MGRPRWLRGEDPEREVEEELAYHVERRAAELRREGVPADEAERRALADFGDLDGTRRYCARQDRRRLRAGVVTGALTALRDDTWLAWRSLARAPRTVIVPMAILAVGITLNALVFSVVRGVLLAPLPFADADRIFVAAEEGTVLGGASYPVLDAWRRQVASAERVAAYLRDESVLDLDGEPGHVVTAVVTEGYLDLLDRPILLGRGLERGDHTVGSAPAVLVSERFWRGRLGADPDVLTRTLTLDDQRRPVVGVVRGGSAFPDGVDLWLPLEGVNPGLLSVPAAKILTTIVRARPGVGQERLREELASVAASVPGGAEEVSAVHAADRFLGDVREPLLLLQGAVLLALLTACANAGGLLLARATARRSDHAVRVSLGAGAVRVARGVVAEGALVGLGAGLAGLALAAVLLEPTLALVPAGLPRTDQISLDRTVALAALALALATGVGTAAAPAITGMRVDPASFLRVARGEAGSAPWLRRFLDGFVVGQVALAVLLTVGAGLLLRSFVATVQEDAGFDPSGITVLAVALPPTRYPDDGGLRAFQRALLERARSLPSADAVALAVNLPISGSNMVSPLMVEGSTGPTDAAQVTAVTSGFFDVLRIPVEGDAFLGEWDLADGRRVIMTDPTLRTAEGRVLAVGDRAHSFFDAPAEDRSPMRDVVGIVGPVRHRGLREVPVPIAYEPFFQRSSVRSFSLLVRSDAPPGSIALAARAIVRELDPGLATDRVTTMEGLVGRSIAEPRFYALGLSIFGGLAVLLALAGCQAGLAFRVASRGRELGLRMALGASSPGLRRMIVVRGLTLAGAGAALGVAAALLATRALESQLYGVTRWDPLTYAGLLVLVLSATAIAADGPARRAASTDPASALRGK